MVIMLVSLVLAVCARSWSQDLITFPIQLHDAQSNSITEELISFDISSPDVHQDVRIYCEENMIQLSFCALLHGRVIEAAREVKSGHIDLPNAHLPRTAAAQRAELQRTFWMDGSHDYGDIKDAEYRALRMALDAFDRRSVHKVVVIHSCTWTENRHANHVLDEILQQLRFYRLYSAVDHIVVLNYGGAIEGQSAASWGSKVTVVQVNTSTAYFEIPSLRIVHELSKYLVTTDSAAGASVLYLHTKGVSYQQTHPQIRDWVDMMLYFLAGRHSARTHLLLSGEVDCIGTNYKTTPFDMFSGNFWWSAAAYLASFPELRHEVSGKYEAETWLLSRRGARVFVMHSSNINHAEREYPPQCYAEAAHRVQPFALSSHRLCSSSEADAKGCGPGGTEQFFDSLPPRPEGGLCGGAVTAWQARRFWQLL